MEDQIENLKKRINWLKRELVMEGYLNGWLIKGFRKELKEKTKKLFELINK